MTGSPLPLRWDSRSLRGLPAGARTAISLFLCLLGLAYGAFLGEIWTDTGFRVDVIVEAYRTFTWGETFGHSFRYLTWFVTSFGTTLVVFHFSGYGEKWKAFLSVWVPLWIVSDIGAVWLIRFSDFFAYQLYLSGFTLAATFLGLFFAVQRALWSDR